MEEAEKKYSELQLKMSEEVRIRAVEDKKYVYLITIIREISSWEGIKCPP